MSAEAEWTENITIKVGDLCRVSNTGYPIAGYYQVVGIERAYGLVQRKSDAKPRLHKVTFRKVFTSGLCPINGKINSIWSQWIPVPKTELEWSIAAKRVKLDKALEHLYSL